ncbi:MAG TPA: alpha/beta hydrolase-fold protein [Caulobacteraceae bacterium]|nr:alpha/beta hydrolase-fold protein [Caulobacteraceae bacterium]
MPDDASTADVALTEASGPLSATMGATRYFEIDSKIASARYGVWVTTPPQYDFEPTGRFPVIYQPDGNFAAAAHASVHAMACADIINPIRPFIMVTIGYTGEDVRRAAAVRVRDLLPPGEPSWEGFDGYLRQAADSGSMPRDVADLWRHNMEHTAADKFLAFITEELHPQIASGWRVDETDAGLYGYSYGGLFAAYAALMRPPLFRKIGAGSPGILAGRSRIFALYDAELASGADHTGRRLHVTVCEREITRPTIYQPIVGLGTAEFLSRLGQTPLKGLTVTTRTVEHESHISGFFPAWYSFLRDCHGIG